MMMMMPPPPPHHWFNFGGFANMIAARGRKAATESVLDVFLFRKFHFSRKVEAEGAMINKGCIHHC